MEDPPHEESICGGALHTRDQYVKGSPQKESICKASSSSLLLPPLPSPHPPKGGRALHRRNQCVENHPHKESICGGSPHKESICERALHKRSQYVKTPPHSFFSLLFPPLILPAPAGGRGGRWREDRLKSEFQQARKKNIEKTGKKNNNNSAGTMCFHMDYLFRKRRIIGLTVKTQCFL